MYAQIEPAEGRCHPHMVVEEDRARDGRAEDEYAATSLREGGRKTGECGSSILISPSLYGIDPKTTTTYIAGVNYQPDSGQVWQNATSKPFKVVVRARR